MTCPKPGGVATLVFVAAAAMSSPHAEAASVTVEAAEVWVLPNYDPYRSSFFDWIDGDGVGEWSDGLTSRGTPSAFEQGIEALDTEDAFLQLGLGICGDLEAFLASGNAAGASAAGASCSHQLLSAGSLTFTVLAGEEADFFPDAIAINRTAPSVSDPLTLTGFSFSDSDDVFDLDAATFPTVIDGDSFAFDLLFTGTEPGDYAATLTLTAEGGLTIPFEISGTVTGVPTPSAALAGLSLAGALALRRQHPPAA